MTKELYEMAVKKALSFYDRARIVLTETEKANVEVADFGLGDLEHVGLILTTYINTSRICAKEMVLFPGQACPEHRHPPFADYIGKEEVFRCRWGEAYLYVEGENSPTPAIQPPETGREYYTVFHEVALRPGDQYTIPQNSRHWFAAGPEGAVISEFSTPSFDEEDIFTDPNIKRIPTID